MGKTIGILGGMGPQATVDLFQKIVSNTPACCDQEHCRILIYNNPIIPPRTNAATDPNHQSPLPELIHSARKLEHAGADFIIMPCHTAHLWLQFLQDSITIPFFSLIDNTVQTMLQQPALLNNKVLLFATQVTINHRLYQLAFANSSIEIIIPSVDEQKAVDSAISYVKAGDLAMNPNLKDLRLILNKYKEAGIHMLMGGCSEIPLLFPYFDKNFRMIDPTLMLAQMAISFAR